MDKRSIPLFSARAMLPLAVTGGIGEGKTTVVGYLREAGYHCVSSDDLVREVLSDRDRQAEFNALYQESGANDRSEFLLELAANTSLRRRLNKLLHPPVLEAMVLSGATVVEVPLLFEACLQGLFRHVWVVTCGREEQLRRLRNRMGSHIEVERLVDAQLPTEAKCAFADEIIRTNRPPFDVHSHVVSLAREWKAG